MMVRDLRVRIAHRPEDRRPSDTRPGAGVPWRGMWWLSLFTSAGAVAASFPGAPPGVRFGVLLAFVCTAPGTALIGALEPATLRVSPAVVLGSGLALGAVSAQLLLLLDAWSPSVVTAVAGTLCLGLLVRMNRRRR